MTVLTIVKKSPWRYEKVAGAPLVPGQMILFDGECARLPAEPIETVSGIVVLRAWTVQASGGGFYVLSEFFTLPLETA